MNLKCKGDHCSSCDMKETPAFQGAQPSPSVPWMLVAMLAEDKADLPCRLCVYIYTCYTRRRVCTHICSQVWLCYQTSQGNVAFHCRLVKPVYLWALESGSVSSEIASGKSL